MRICFVGPANSAHIVKWCNWFTSHGHEIHVISFTPGEITGVKVHLIDLGVDANGSDFGKLKYLLTGRQIKNLIKEIQPDVVNAHYATSYGMAMALSGIKGYALSVWGSDVYDFPKKSPLHKALLKYSLKKAGKLFSTSQAMADEAAKYTNRKFEITPFGVDMQLFNPDKRTRKVSDPLTVGIYKVCTDVPGIDNILKAAAIIKNNYKEYEVYLRIFGDGPQLSVYRQLVSDSGIDGITVFSGRIPQEESEQEKTNLDVALMPETMTEYSGIADEEAQGCSTPFMTTDVEGFIEAVMPDVSGTDAAKKEEAIAEAMVKLYTDPGIRETLEIECKRSTAEKSVGEEASEIQQGSILIAVTIKEKQDFVVGTVKGLSDKYGIPYILEAVAAVKNDNQIPIRLRIAGKGPQEQEYRRLAEDLGISDITTWLGFISQEQAAVEWANMDTAIIPSTLESESFGVSAVEAQACGTPVIISDIPGLMEATKPGKSSIVVKRCESEEIADAIRRIYADSILQKNMQRFGLEYVHGNYELNKCFQHIEKLLKNCLQ